MATTLRTSGLTMGSSTLDVSSTAPSAIFRVWANFNGNANPSTIRGSNNVTSTTYLGTGNYRVNFTTAMSSNNYAVHVGASNAPARPMNFVNNTAQTSNCEVVQADSNAGAGFNNPFMFFIVTQ